MEYEQMMRLSFIGYLAGLLLGTIQPVNEQEEKYIAEFNALALKKH